MEIGKRASFPFGGLKFLIVCFLRQLFHFHGNVRQRLVVREANNRNEQTVFYRYGHADVDVVVLDGSYRPTSLRLHQDADATLPQPL